MSLNLQVKDPFKVGTSALIHPHDLLSHYLIVIRTSTCYGITNNVSYWGNYLRDLV